MSFHPLRQGWFLSFGQVFYNVCVRVCGNLVTLPSVHTNSCFTLCDYRLLQIISLELKGLHHVISSLCVCICVCGVVITGAQVSVCVCVGVVCTCVCLKIYSHLSLTATLKLRNCLFRSHFKQTEASVCVYMLLLTLATAAVRNSLHCKSEKVWKVYIVLAHHTTPLWGELTVSWAEAAAAAKGAACLSSEWHILRLETPNTRRTSICLFLLCLQEPAGSWAHGTNLDMSGREREGFRAGWGERGCSLPAHGVISSCCGYCKWDREGNGKKGPQLPRKVMALGRAEFHSTKVLLKHLAFTVKPQVWELYPKMETRTVTIQLGQSS